MSVLSGCFLVASPQLGDGNFNRSVVLIVNHDKEGAFGLVLNRPTENNVAEIWKLVAEQPTDCEKPLYLGGPVSGPLVCVHTSKAAAEAKVADGVFFSAHKDHLRRVVADSKQPFRLFTGYSGWGAGQLEAELEAGGWLVVPATAELVFYEQEDLWERVVSSISQQIVAPAVKAHHVPEDPSLN